jgi:hypothetical protein
MDRRGDVGESRKLQSNCHVHILEQCAGHDVMVDQIFDGGKNLFTIVAQGRIAFFNSTTELDFAWTTRLGNGHSRWARA